jgi:hypothetical protein
MLSGITRRDEKLKGSSIQSFGSERDKIREIQMLFWNKGACTLLHVLWYTSNVFTRFSAYYKKNTYMKHEKREYESAQ